MSVMTQLAKLAKGDPAALEDKVRSKLEKSIRSELEKEIRAELEEEFKGRGAASSSSAKPKSTPKPKQKKDSTKAAASKAAAGTQKKKSSGMFGPKKIKKTYEGEPGGKQNGSFPMPWTLYTTHMELEKRSNLLQF